MSGQETQAAGIQQSMDQHFDQLQVDMARTESLQGQLVQGQQHGGISEETGSNYDAAAESLLQQNAKDELRKKQEEMLDLQRQTLDMLAVILSRVEALLTQTYELHEYPIPRLFIVLSKAMGLRDKFKRSFPDQFRLYFL
ncbi:hypothetical protein BGZ65_004420 [Modicella reniformis]|uniref:Uncharacterized protein n=1 Tax=Modicella reniformis TaxID=1440133 RepID=A0A9P6LZB6_9FUNG|nr:hypothetical protein BGZ65_004420 [Modicella reniformis]